MAVNAGENIKKSPPVLYASSHGSTARLAGWIASSVGGRCEPLNGATADPAVLAKEKVVVFGGWVNSGKVTGLKELIQRFERSGCPRLIVFAVGILKPDEDRRDTLLLKNVPARLRDRVDFFLLRGAMDRNTHSFAEDMRLRLLRIKLEGKKNPTNAERENWHAVTFPSDFTNPAAVVPIIEDVRKYIKTEDK